MTSDSMIDNFLKKHTATQCDDYGEDEACNIRDTIRTDFNGNVLGRASTNKVRVRKLKSLIKKTA